MSAPSPLLSALLDTSPGLTGGLEVHTACGISWDANDVIRFLGKCKWVEHPERPGHWCLIWTGAKSRGGASKPDKRGRRRGKARQCYGTFGTKGKSVRAHKFYAVAILGLRPGPDDELDHECHLTLCLSDIRCVHKDVNQGRIRRKKADRVATNGANGVHVRLKRPQFVQRALLEMRGRIAATTERAVLDALSSPT